MPSPESEAFIKFFRDMIDKVHQQPEVWGTPAHSRILYETIHALASEPEDVTYRNVQCPGTVQPAVWAIPIKAAKDTAILFLPGGGFTCGSPYSHRKMVAHIAKASGVPALLIDYRKNPDYVYPCAIEDTVAAYRWLTETNGIPAGRIAVMGDLAGAQLAMTSVFLARDRGLAAPGAVVALSPWIDLETRNEGLDTYAESDPTVHKESLQRLVESYFVKAGVSPAEPMVNPLRADLANYPPTFISWGTKEALQDNGAQFADKARAAKVEVEMDVVEGLYHVHPFMAGRAPEADETISRIGNFLKKKLAL